MTWNSCLKRIYHPLISVHFTANSEIPNSCWHHWLCFLVEWVHWMNATLNWPIMARKFQQQNYSKSEGGSRNCCWKAQHSAVFIFMLYSTSGVYFCAVAAARVSFVQYLEHLLKLLHWFLMKTSSLSCTFLHHYCLRFYWTWVHHKHGNYCQELLASWLINNLFCWSRVC